MEFSMRKQQAWLFVMALLMMSGVPSPAFADKSNTEKAGDALFVLLPLSGFAATLVKHDREGQIQFLKSLAATAIVTGGLKAAVDKRRPNGECCESFPSAHTSFAFMGATFIHKRYGKRYAIPAYAAAAFVAHSRVFADKHFVEDVVAGAAIGFLSSYFLTTAYRGVTITPVAGPDVIGFSFSGRW